MRPLVSVLIPAFNAERWIAASVGSALGQTWPAVEVIVVDDASTDTTLTRLRAISSPRLQVIARPANGGASAARNVAYRVAQGDFIQWLDADDLLAPDKIALQMNEFERNGDPKQLFSGSFGEFFSRPERARFEPTSLWQDLSPIDFLLHKFTDNAWFNPAVWLSNRGLAEAAGPWNEHLSLDDDGEYCSRLVSRASSIHFVRSSHVYYRRANPTSLSRGISAAACESLLHSLGLCIGHLRALEDSPRTRAAGVRLLQNWVDRSDCFWDASESLFQRARALAQELGGDLRPQAMNWKYAPIEAVFGSGPARRVRQAWWNLKLHAQAGLDRLAPAGIGRAREPGAH